MLSRCLRTALSDKNKVIQMELEGSKHQKKNSHKDKEMFFIKRFHANSFWWHHLVADVMENENKFLSFFDPFSCKKKLGSRGRCFRLRLYRRGRKQNKFRMFIVGTFHAFILFPFLLFVNNLLFSIQRNKDLDILDLVCPCILMPVPQMSCTRAWRVYCPCRSCNTSTSRNMAHRRILRQHIPWRWHRLSSFGWNVRSRGWISKRMNQKNVISWKCPTHKLGGSESIMDGSTYSISSNQSLFAIRAATFESKYPRPLAFIAKFCPAYGNWSVLLQSSCFMAHWTTFNLHKLANSHDQVCVK